MDRKRRPNSRPTPAEAQRDAHNRLFSKGDQVVFNSRAPFPGGVSIITGEAFIKMLPVVVCAVAGHGLVPVEQLSHQGKPLVSNHND